jgi:outer membrane protein TolC
MTVALTPAGADSIDLVQNEQEARVVTADGGSMPASTSESLVSALDDTALRLLAEEVLDRNPSLATLAARALAADQKAPQLSALPDPVAALTLFLLAPQTRVGPQRASVSLSQRLPWFGKLQLKEQKALFMAAAAWAELEAARLRLIIEVRRLYHELSYLDEEERIIREDRATLEHYEQLAQARYASGVGLGQSVIKIQAEITKADTRLVEVEQRRASLLATVNALRDRPDRAPLSVGSIPDASAGDYDYLALRQRALSSRPEIAAVDALIESASTQTELTKKEYKPDFTVGLNYGFVEKRDDRAGRELPVEGNGDDVFGISAGINLPVWRKRLAAGVEEATQLRLGAEQQKRAVTADIEASLRDLHSRIPLIQRQLQLFDNVLIIQAEESLRSAEAAYAAGTVGALDLLDAERVLLQVRIGAERVRADLAIALAQLEGAVAAPLDQIDRNGSTS